MRRTKYERPRDVRFPHSRRGELSAVDATFPCLIQDISVSGVCGICARDLTVGQVLELRFELTPDHFHQCIIRVQHFEHGCFGALITDVGEHENKLFHQYVEKRFRELKRL